MTKLIAEIGINHRGELDNAKKLILNAASSKTWGVKFQYRSEDFFAENHELGSTLIKSELERSSLNTSWIPELINISKDNKLKIGFSFFRKKDLEDFFLTGFEIDFIKIPSAEFRNISLIKLAKTKNLPVMISYGGGSEDEIEKYLKLSNLDKNDCAFHCIANYPISIGNQQLSFISRMKNMTKANIGYSSHDENCEIALLALQYEIDFIERHICLSKEDLGLDISTSSDLNEFIMMNKIISKYNEIISCPRREINQGEILNIRSLGTGLYFNENHKKGDEILTSSLIEKSPATGLRSHEIENIQSFKLTQDVHKGDPLLDSHLNRLSKISIKVQEFRDAHKISLPVRLHDFKNIRNRFNGRFFELHLSYEEVFKIQINPGLLTDLIEKEDSISIHLPDYISSDSLIDPFSPKNNIRKKSREIIDTCIEASKLIKNISRNDCLILGSFSERSSEKEIFYKEFKNFCENIKNDHNIYLLAQWLPKKAWYFGGSAILNQFCEEEDIDLIIKNNISLCLDFSHLILSANYFNADWHDWYSRLKKQIKHIHISDGEGIDGEGVDFGKGDLDSYQKILNHPEIKVLEVWEGHHNVGEKFYAALEFLFDKVKK
ncbi:N-acetylneuraminate synthase family protein [SAR86 cluster bacterium]|nr:N-acetylneuraminate synthase family protein [SAR86 cluster bacterium]